MHRVAISLAFAAACYFACLARARACSCVESAGVSEDLTASGSVFEGRVTELRREPKLHRLTARVQVLRRWKGAPQSAVDVVTIDQGSLCGFGFERGKSFLLFTPEAEGTLNVSLCSRSKPSESAAADFAELDRLAASGASADASPSSASAQPTASAPPLPAPPTAATAPSPTSSMAPRRGGCAGCGVSTSSSGGSLIALTLVLTGVRRLRRKASNTYCQSGHGRALADAALARSAQGRITRVS